MVELFRALESEEIIKSGYGAKYVADIQFLRKVESGGFILVTIPAGAKSSPHIHRELQEVFVALTTLTMQIDEKILQLEPGDIVLVEPGESHCFSASEMADSVVLAIKFPNLKEDKIDPQ